MRTKLEAKDARLGTALGITAGIFVLVNGIFWLLFGSLVTMLLPISGVSFTMLFVILGVLGIVFAALIFAGTILVYFFKKEYIGGLFILIFSVLSLGIIGGFFVGFVLGVVGAYFILTKK